MSAFTSGSSIVMKVTVPPFTLIDAPREKVNEPLRLESLSSVALILSFAFFLTSAARGVGLLSSTITSLIFNSPCETVSTLPVDELSEGTMSFPFVTVTSLPPLTEIKEDPANS